MTNGCKLQACGNCQFIACAKRRCLTSTNRMMPPDEVMSPHTPRRPPADSPPPLFPFSWPTTALRDAMDDRLLLARPNSHKPCITLGTHSMIQGLRFFCHSSRSSSSAGPYLHNRHSRLAPTSIPLPPCLSPTLDTPPYPLRHPLLVPDNPPTKSPGSSGLGPPEVEPRQQQALVPQSAGRLRKGRPVTAEDQPRPR